MQSKNFCTSALFLLIYRAVREVISGNTILVLIFSTSFPFTFSIKGMAEHIRFVIEKEEKLQEEILLKDKDFVVDLVRSEFSIQPLLNGSRQLRIYCRFSKKKNETLFFPRD